MVLINLIVFYVFLSIIIILLYIKLWGLLINVMASPVKLIIWIEYSNVQKPFSRIIILFILRSMESKAIIYYANKKRTTIMNLPTI